MAQKRFIQHLDPLPSFEANEEFLGIFEPGRYRGFDVFNQTGPLAGDLLHTTTGIVKTAIDNITQSNPQGLNITKQGTFIYEDAAISLSGFGSNGANAFERLDLIIMEHEWLVAAGGQAAVYSIIQGPDGAPDLPPLTNPAKQTIVGVMSIPASEANLNNATYTFQVAPGLAGNNLAYLDVPQLYTRPQGFHFGTLDYGTWYAGGVLDLTGLAGNNYSIILATTDDLDTLTSTIFKKGTTVILKVTQTGTAGFITETGNITLPDDLTTIEIVSGTYYTFFTEDGINWVLISTSYNANAFRTKVVPIGDWDMAAAISTFFAHGIADFTKIRSIIVIIRADDGLTYFPLDRYSGQLAQGGVDQIGSTDIVLQRLTGGGFDQAGFSDIFPTIPTRGWATITYGL